MIESVDSLRLKTKAEFIQILRWEDDGGAVFDVDPPFPQVVGTSTPRPRNVATDDLFYAELKKEGSLILDGVGCALDQDM